MGKKDMIKMKLTPEEVALIENIRSMQGNIETRITTEDTRRELFLETQDREELCLQLVDLTIDGDWTPDN